MSKDKNELDLEMNEHLARKQYLMYIAKLMAILIMFDRNNKLTASYV